MTKEINQSRNQTITQQNAFQGNLLPTEMKKTKVKMNKPVYLRMPILDISKTLMDKFWYDYFKSKCGDRAKLCYTDTDSFIIHLITEDLFQQVKISNWVV